VACSALCNDDVGRVLFARHYDEDPARTFVHQDYAVLLSTFDTKVMLLPVTGREADCTHMYFAEAFIASGL
jgi:hypothetical protein